MADSADLLAFINTYSWAYDAPDLDLMDSLFADDATFSMRIAGGDLISFESRTAIMDLMRNSLATQTDQRRHVNTNFVHLGSENGVHSTRHYLVLIGTDNGEINLLSAGVYSMEIREVDGGLKIGKLHLDLDKAY